MIVDESYELKILWASVGITHIKTFTNSRHGHLLVSLDYYTEDELQHIRERVNKKFWDSERSNLRLLI